MTNISADFVIKLALILILSILPSLVYLLIFKTAKKRWQTRLRRAQILSNHQHYRERLNRDFYSYSRQLYSESDRRRPVTKYFIGDTTCINNARSPYIRCAINPEGPCDGCVHYQKHHT
ncbi:hypothetical protein IQ255_25810 [Pleurocapsales cyanobacterium LEGE 10410]|nr:hypothetical protein [Pleurocapsales cyanobacterium LEGE 10410]